MFLWDGAWSFVLPPPLIELPLAALTAIVCIGYLRAIIRTPPAPFEWIFPLTLALFATGLIHQALIVFAEFGTLSAPTWYLHSLAPIFAPMLALGLTQVAHRRLMRPLVRALVIFPIFFLPFGTGLMALYYAGCGDKYPGHTTYDLSSARSCILDVTGLGHNLLVLSDPYLSIALFGAGWTLMLVGVVMSIRIWSLESASPESPRAHRATGTHSRDLPTEGATERPFAAQ
jgi:hypothetical protein